MISIWSAMIFLVLLVFELWTDVSTARQNKWVKHGMSILRLPVFFLMAWLDKDRGAELVPLLIFWAGAFWIVFDILFNLTNNQNILYVPDPDKETTAFLDRIFARRPVFRLVLKIVILGLAIFLMFSDYGNNWLIILGVILASYFAAIIISPDARFVLNNELFAQTFLVAGIISFFLGTNVAEIEGLTYDILGVALFVAPPAFTLVDMLNLTKRKKE